MDIHNTIIKELLDNSNSSKKINMEKYMKHTTEFRGINAPQVTIIFQKVWQDHIKTLKDFSQLSELAEILLKSSYGEDKSIGMMIYGKIFKEIDKNYIDTKVKSFFLEKNIVGWAMCDSLCGKFLRHWSLLSRENTLFLSEWRNEENLWLKRASCVSFVTRAKHGDKPPNFEGFTEILFQICNKVVECPERFAQLGCGWLLREISLSDKEKVKQFIQNNLDKFSREGLKYAVEKMNGQESKKILENHKKTLKN